MENIDAEKKKKVKKESLTSSTPPSTTSAPSSSKNGSISVSSNSNSIKISSSTSGATATSISLQGQTSTSASSPAPKKKSNKIKSKPSIVLTSSLNISNNNSSSESTSALSGGNIVKLPAAVDPIQMDDSFAATEPLEPLKIVIATKNMGKGKSTAQKTVQKRESTGGGGKETKKDTSVPPIIRTISQSSTGGGVAHILTQWEEDCMKVLRKIKEHEFVKLRPATVEGPVRQTAIANFFAPVLELYPSIAEEYLKVIKYVQYALI